MMENLPAVIEFTDEKSEAVPEERKPFVEWFKELRLMPVNTGIASGDLKARIKDAQARIDKAKVYNSGAAPGSADWVVTRSIIQSEENEIVECKRLAVSFAYDIKE